MRSRRAITPARARSSATRSGSGAATATPTAPKRSASDACGKKGWQAGNRLKAALIRKTLPGAVWRVSRRFGTCRENVATSARRDHRSEEHTSELQSLMRISYAVFCLKKKKENKKLNGNIRN